MRVQEKSDILPYISNNISNMGTFDSVPGGGRGAKKVEPREPGEE